MLFGFDRIQTIDPVTSQTVRVFSRPDETLYRITASSNGKILAAVGEAAVWLWDVTSGRLLRELEVVEQPASSLALSPDGSIVAATYGDATVRFWNVATGEVVGKVPGGRWLCPNAFSPDGNSLLTVDKDGSIKLWEVRTGRELWRSVPLPGGFSGGVALTSDRQLVATTSWTATIIVREVASGKEAYRFDLKPREMAHLLAFATDRKTIATVTGDDTTLQLWDVTTGMEKLPFVRHYGRVLSMAVSPDEKTLASAGSDGSLRLWDVSTGRPTHAIVDAPMGLWGETNAATLTRIRESRIGPPGSIAFDPTGRRLGSITFDGALTVWNLLTAKQIDHIDHGEPLRICAGAFTPGGKSCVTVSCDGVSLLRDTATGNEIRRANLARRGLVRAVTLSKDGQLMALTGENGLAEIWETSGFRCRSHVRVPGTYIECLALSPDGKTLGLGCRDGELRVWDLAIGEVQRVRGVDNPDMHTIKSIAFSPDGSRIAWAGSDHVVRVWGTRMRADFDEFRGHQGPVNQVAFGGSSRLVGSASDDGTVLVWDVSRPAR